MQRGRVIASITEQGATAVGVQRGQRGHWDRKVGMSVARAVVWGEEDYVFVAGSRRVQLVVVDVEMLEGVGMLRADGAKI